ncbi:MAG: cell division protein FtsA [Parcubacteria group bacterium Athens1014_10]|nr:MAG: cell division protein FtsA [Parcubacteria group bacterium Athens1014_10]TSD06113.1 MAG: cell division protein FtsA [Parcubacteria group bacterium Athens0714_12]
MKEKVIIGLDIGTTAIKAVAAQLLEDKIHIIGATEKQSEGVSKGTISSVEDAVSSISACLEKMERMIGVPLEKAYVGISGNHITSQETKGVVTISKADGEIKEEDIERVLEAAQAVATPPNYEILHVIPKSFTIDNQSGIKDPLGMAGIRLEVEAEIIEGLSNQVKNLTKVIYRTGLEIEDLVFSIIATSEAVLNKKQKELGAAVIDLGGATTSLAVFEEGDLLTAKVLPVGGNHITSDIAIGLKTSIEMAEKIKLLYGSSSLWRGGRRGEINLNEIDENENGIISKRQIGEIIGARIEEIFKMADQELHRISRSGKLPAGIVLTGGGSKLEGIIEIAKEEFKLPASLGVNQNVISAVDKIYDPIFSCALGLVLWGAQTEKTTGEVKFLAKLSNKISKIIKKLFKKLIP